MDEKEIEKKRIDILKSKLNSEEELPDKLERERSVLSKRDEVLNKIYKYQEETGEPTDEEADDYFMSQNLLNFKDPVTYKDLKERPADDDA